MLLIQIAFLLIIFIVAIMFSYGMMRLLIPEQTQIRLKQIAEESTKLDRPDSDKLIETINIIATPFAKLSLPEDGWENSELRKRFMHAGYRSRSIPVYYLAAKTLLVFVFPAILFLLIELGVFELSGNRLMIFLLTSAALGYYLPSLILNHKVTTRQRELFENFPDAIDLMTVCIEAGLGMDAAITKVSEEMRLKCLPLAEELHLVNLEMRAGRSRDQALHNLALRTGVEEIEGLVAMLIQTDRFGTSVADALRVHSDMLRTKRRLRAEEAAAKIALKLLFPLIFCIFPALFLVIMGPAVIQIYRVLLPTMAGQ